MVRKISPLSRSLRTCGKPSLIHAQYIGGGIHQPTNDMTDTDTESCTDSEISQSEFDSSLSEDEYYSDANVGEFEDIDEHKLPSNFFKMTDDERKEYAIEQTWDPKLMEFRYDIYQSRWQDWTSDMALSSNESGADEDKSRMIIEQHKQSHKSKKCMLYRLLRKKSLEWQSKSDLYINQLTDSESQFDAAREQLKQTQLEMIEMEKYFEKSNRATEKLKLDKTRLEACNLELKQKVANLSKSLNISRSHFHDLQPQNNSSSIHDKVHEQMIKIEHNFNTLSNASSKVLILNKFNSLKKEYAMQSEQYLELQAIIKQSKIAVNRATLREQEKDVLINDMQKHQTQEYNQREKIYQTYIQQIEEEKKYSMKMENSAKKYKKKVKALLTVLALNADSDYEENANANILHKQKSVHIRLPKKNRRSIERKDDDGGAHSHYNEFDDDEYYTHTPKISHEQTVALNRMKIKITSNDRKLLLNKKTRKRKKKSVLLTKPLMNSSGSDISPNNEIFQSIKSVNRFAFSNIQNKRRASVPELNISSLNPNSNKIEKDLLTVNYCSAKDTLVRKSMNNSPKVSLSESDDDNPMDRNTSKQSLSLTWNCKTDDSLDSDCLDIESEDGSVISLGSIVVQGEFRNTADFFKTQMNASGSGSGSGSESRGKLRRGSFEYIENDETLNIPKSKKVNIISISSLAKKHLSQQRKQNEQNMKLVNISDVDRNNPYLCGNMRDMDVNKNTNRNKNYQNKKSRNNDAFRK